MSIFYYFYFLKNSILFINLLSFNENLVKSINILIIKRGIYMSEKFINIKQQIIPI